MDDSIVIGVDIGGSHITAALINLTTRSVVEKSLVRENVNAQGPMDEIITAWTSVIERTRSAGSPSIKRIGIAMPGPFQYETGISLMQNQNKYDALYNMNIKTALADNLQIDTTDIVFINDAECFLRGEAFGGAARDMSPVIGLTLGTGLGSARFRNGMSEDADLWNSPFLDGIAEDYFSTRWFTGRYLVLTGSPINEVKELVDMKISNNLKEQIFTEFGNNLSRFLKPLILQEKPQCVVIGGNISNSFHLFSESLMRGLTEGCNNAIIRKAILGEQAPLIGTATYWYERELQNAS